MKPYIVPVKRLVMTDKHGDWCKLPYRNHPKGCPNYGRNPKCPPNAPLATDYFNTEMPMWLVHSEFDLEAHTEKMRTKHPNWSWYQCRCVLYWQSTSRKQMTKRVQEVVRELRCNRITACPEGMGVNVYATARASGLYLERIKDLKTCRHITLIGYGGTIECPEK